MQETTEEQEGDRSGDGEAPESHTKEWWFERWIGCGRSQAGGFPPLSMPPEFERTQWERFADELNAMLEESDTRRKAEVRRLSEDVDHARTVAGGYREQRDEARAEAAELRGMRWTGEDATAEDKGELDALRRMKARMEEVVARSPTSNAGRCMASILGEETRGASQGGGQG